MAGNPYTWETTAANNDDADGDINFLEGQTPGSVNNSARGVMAGVAGWLKDTNGSVETGGSANGYTVTSNVSYAALATGVVLGVKANHTNTGASTLTLNALASKAIRAIAGAADRALMANEIVDNGHYILRYDAAANSAAGAWILLNPTPLVQTTSSVTTLTNQTSVEWASLPAGVNKFEIMFSGVSTNGTDSLVIVLGDAGGYEITGYLGSSVNISAGGVSSNPHGAGFLITGGVAAATVLHGNITLELVDSATFTWSISGSLSGSNAEFTIQTAGSYSLSAELTKVLLGTVDTIDQFDAGKVVTKYWVR
jgi:hypothetical protein